jgi:hypothetical protein
MRLVGLAAKFLHVTPLDRGVLQAPIAKYAEGER